jgi:nucleotide-binding universal stress UspA family protein
MRKFAEETAIEKSQPRRSTVGRDSIEPITKGNRRLRRASPDRQLPKFTQFVGEAVGFPWDDNVVPYRTSRYHQLPKSTRSGRLIRAFMINPSPYKKIAVASTFSPRFEQVLSEAKRIRDRFGSALSLIYVGERDEKTAQKFRDALVQLKLPDDSTIHYRQGDPAEAILETLADNNVDLVMAGALEKEVILRPVLGNVARRLVREAGCSVLLFTKPEHEPKPLRQIVFIADYSEHGQHALKKTLGLAVAEACERLYVVRIYTTFDEARASLRADAGDGAPRPRTFEEEEAALEDFILAAGHTDVPIEARCLRGNTGFAASDFVQSVEADLLVVPVQASGHTGERLPNHIAWITDAIPCNLWVIR